MNQLHRTLCVVSMASLLALGACGKAPSVETSWGLTARLSGAAEVPAVVTDAKGMLEATLAAGSNVLNWKITYSGLSGPATGAHFHGPAGAGQNAGVLVPVPAPMTSPITGSATLTAAQVADLTAGNWYLNLHTAANPDGELRGQVTVVR